MSSTDTEKSAHQVLHTRRQKPKKKAKAKPGCQLSDPSKPSDDFQNTFWKKFSNAQKLKRGCTFCNCTRLEVAEQCLDGLVEWRRGFRKLTPEVQDRELRWIFTACRRTSESVRTMRVEGDANMKKDDEAISTDTSKSADHKPSSTSASSCDAEHAEAKAGPLSASLPEAKRKLPDRRVRESTKIPSVRLLSFIAPAAGSKFVSSSDGFVCVKASRFLLGIGSERLERVLQDRPDRRRGKRQIPVHTSKQRDICNAFLQMKYHSDGEFLPDRFEFDNMSQVVDAQMLPGPKTQQHEEESQDPQSDSDEHVSGDSHGNLVGRDKEEDERAIAAMAIGSVTLNEPFRNASIGPGQRPGPRRYLGVVKPMILYESMVIWCNENQMSPHPSFTTFRRALKEARPWIRFRYSVLTLIVFIFRILHIIFVSD